MTAGTSSAFAARDAAVPERSVRPAGELEDYRAELTGYCHRLLGSAFDADDAAQETLVRAWRGLDDFRGRSQLRTWLYRIATNVCLDMLSARQRRAASALTPAAAAASAPSDEELSEASGIEPVAGSLGPTEGADPAEIVLVRESVRLAFTAALGHLPPRQRAVLILRDVLRWRTSEAAELLDTTAAAVNSALQRARARVAASRPDPDGRPTEMDETKRELLTRYLSAFEHQNVDALVALLQEDATTVQRRVRHHGHGARPASLRAS